MSIYSNDNIRKIAKLTTRELPQKSKNAKITVRENNGLYSIHDGYILTGINLCLALPKVCWLVINNGLVYLMLPFCDLLVNGCTIVPLW